MEKRLLCNCSRRKRMNLWEEQPCRRHSQWRRGRTCSRHWIRDSPTAHDAHTVRQLSPCGTMEVQRPTCRPLEALTHSRWWLSKVVTPVESPQCTGSGRTCGPVRRAHAGANAVCEEISHWGGRTSKVWCTDCNLCSLSCCTTGREEVEKTGSQVELWEMGGVGKDVVRFSFICHCLWFDL